MKECINVPMKPVQGVRSESGDRGSNELRTE